MSEDSEPAADNQNSGQLSHERILFITAALVVIGSVLGFAFKTLSFGFGVLIGGVLSFINYYWLKESLKKFFAKVSEGESPRFWAATYVLRYLLMGAILGIVYVTGVVPLVALMLGLGSLAFAVMIEGFLLLFSSFFNKKEF